MGNNTHTDSSFPQMETEEIAEIEELLERIKSGEIRCTYCGEAAVKMSDSEPSVPICDIPSNH
jgi:hypothetical protein